MQCCKVLSVGMQEGARWAQSTIRSSTASTSSMTITTPGPGRGQPGHRPCRWVGIIVETYLFVKHEVVMLAMTVMDLRAIYMKSSPGHGPEVFLQQPLPVLRGPRPQARGLAASVSPAAARARGGTGTIAQFIFNYFPH